MRSGLGLKDKMRFTALKLSAAALVVAIGALLAVPAAAADTTGTATADADAIVTGESVGVTLTVAGDKTISVTPTDVVFVIDGSGSVGPVDFKVLRAFVVDTIEALATDGLFDAGGTVSAVHYSGPQLLPPDAYEVVLDRESDLTAAIAGINSIVYKGGFTCTPAAIAAATDLVTAGVGERTELMVSITDGAVQCGNPNGSAGDGDVTDDAAAAIDAGVELFAIGVGSAVSQTDLEQQASDPVADHTFSVADFDDLTSVLGALVQSLSLPVTTGAAVVVEPSDSFGLTGAVTPSQGSVTPTPEGLEWDVGDFFGNVTLSYSLQSTAGVCGTDVSLHDFLSYSDDQNAVVVFEDLTVDISGCAIADAGPDQTVAINSLTGADVTLDATGSSGAESYEWSWPGGDTSGATPSVALPVGTTEITLEVTDAGGGTDTDTVIVSVVVDADALCLLVQELLSGHAGLANSMCQQLDQATTEAFVHHVQAQSGKALTEQAAQLLQDLAAQL